MPPQEDKKVYLEEVEVNDCVCERPVCTVVVETMAPKMKPTGRAGHTLTYSTIGSPYAGAEESTSPSKNDYIVMIGGSNCKLEFFNDIWIYHIDSQMWFPLRQSNSPKNPVDKSAPPAMSPRSGHVAVSLPSVDYSLAPRGKITESLYVAEPEDDARVSGPVSRVLVVGGQEVAINHKRQNLDITSFNDMWLLELYRTGPNPLSVKAVWVPITPSLPKKFYFPALNSACAAYHDGKVVIFGGANDQGPSDRTFVYDLATNKLVEAKTTGEHPSPREMMHFGTAPIPGNNENSEAKAQRMGLYVWSGRDFDGVCGDMYCLDIGALNDCDNGDSKATTTPETYSWTRVGPSPTVCAAASTFLTAPIIPKPVVTPAVDNADNADLAAAMSSLALASTAVPSSLFFTVGGSDNDAIVSDVYLSQPLHTFAQREKDAKAAWEIKNTENPAPKKAQNKKKGAKAAPPSPATDIAARRCVACGGVRGWQRLENIPTMEEFMTKNSEKKSEYSPGDDILRDSVAVNQAESPYFRMAGALCSLPTHEEDKNGRKVVGKAFMFGGTTAENDHVDTKLFYFFARE